MNRHERGKELAAKIEDATQELSRQLEAGLTERFEDYLRFYALHFRSYSMGNTFLIKGQRPHASFCAGMKKWNSLGCKVKPGEQAIWIRAPRFAKELNQNTGKEELRLIGYLAVPVFDISQVEGADQLPAVREPLEGSFEELYQHLTQIAENNGIMVTEQELSRTLGGMAMDNSIVIRALNAVSVKFQTLIHEIAHVLLHKPGCETPRWQRELEAESTTFVIMHLLDFPTDASAGYILAWRGNAEALQQSMQSIHYATTTIYGWLEEAQVEAAVS